MQAYQINYGVTGCEGEKRHYGEIREIHGLRPLIYLSPNCETIGAARDFTLSYAEENLIHGKFYVGRLTKLRARMFYGQIYTRHDSGMVLLFDTSPIRTNMESVMDWCRAHLLRLHNYAEPFTIEYVT